MKLLPLILYSLCLVASGAGRVLDFTPVNDLGLPREGDPSVDFVIVTTDDLRPAYENLRRFDEMLGIRTTIRTMTWIEQHYPGLDGAEKIREFLKQARACWGIQCVLLGGDVQHVPCRNAYMERVDPDPWNEIIATDLYYSDLDGTWNRDGDERFGEIADSLDLAPDVAVGRLTMITPAGVVGYVEKLNAYFFDTLATAHERLIFTSADLFIPNDALEMAQRFSDHLPAELQRVFLNETVSATVAESLARGSGITIGIGHGDVNQLMVRSSPRDYFTNFDLDSLPDGTVHGLYANISCYTNRFHGDCLGEHWVNGTGRGGIVYHGPSTSSESFLHEEIVTVMLDSLAAFPVGVAAAKAKQPFIPQSQDDDWYRFYQFSLNLLGDPTIRLFDGIPSPFASVSLTGQLDLGTDTLKVTVNPSVTCTVAVFKPGDVVGKACAPGGACLLPIVTSSEGELIVTVLHPGFLPYRDTIPVQPTGPCVALDGFAIDDSLGNQDGKANPGEYLRLTAILQNSGSAPAENVWAQLASQDSAVTFVVDTSSYPDLSPGACAANSVPFEFTLGTDVADGQVLRFSLTMYCSGTTPRTDTFQIAVNAWDIGPFAIAYRITGDTLSFAPTLANSGSCSVPPFILHIHGLTGIAAIIDSSCQSPAIPAYSRRSTSPDSLKAMLDGAAVARFRLVALLAGDTLFAHTLRLDTLAAPESLTALAEHADVRLAWAPIAGALGYRIHRSLAPSGPYDLLDAPLSPQATYQDRHVEPRQPYYYYVAAVDSAYGNGPCSDTVCGISALPLQTGWPRTVYGYVFGSPGFGDLDPAYSGLEIVLGCRDGAVYAWHSDGTPVQNDGRLFMGAGEVWSSPALGDIDHDGFVEAAFGQRYVYSGNLHCVDRNGNDLNGWPRTIGGGTISSPVLADLDQDQHLEVIAASLAGGLYVFHHDGSGVFAPDGLLKQLYGAQFGTPAVGDVNADGALEIVCAGGTGSESLFVWDSAGNYLAPFPVALAPCLSYSVVMGDICGGPELEIVTYADGADRVYVVNSQGEILWFREFLLGDVEAGPVLGDLSGDGRPEVICGNNHGLIAFDSLGNTLPGFPVTGNHDFKLPIVADANADGVTDILVGSSDWHCHGIQENGLPTPGFPVALASGIDGSPAVYDIDQDGRLELLIADNGFRCYVFELPTQAQRGDWCKFRYDAYNTGTYNSGNFPVMEQERLAAQGPRMCLSIHPTVSTGKVNFSLGGARIDTPVSVAVYDIAGRLAWNTQLLAGDRKALWNGLDGQGRKVPAGIYFLVARQGSATAKAKIIIVR